MKKCLILFVEGDTEVEFYKKLIANERNKTKNNRFNISIECKNVKGIGNFKNNVIRKFEKEIKPKYNKYEFTIVLCSDTDVFELESKPPVNWNEVISKLRELGAQNIIIIKAEKCIEDWFLYDSKSILSFLKLNKSTKVKGKNGYDKLKNLFKKANKMYFKGMNCKDLIDVLDIEKISSKVYNQLKPLLEALKN